MPCLDCGKIETPMSRSLLLIAAMLLSTGCPRSDQRIIGVVPKGASHIFWQTVHAGAIKAAGEIGCKVDWNAPPLEIDASRQIEIVDSMINRHVDGIVLAPVDKQALVAVVERAAAKGIPVAIFDSAIDTEKIISYVATDNMEAGRMGARRMGETLGGSAATMERGQGFQEEIRKRYPRIYLLPVHFGRGGGGGGVGVGGGVVWG